MRSLSSNGNEGARKLPYIKLNPPAAIATATPIPNTPTSARPGYLIKTRAPSLTSNHQESSVREDCIILLRRMRPPVHFRVGVIDFSARSFECYGFVLTRDLAAALSS